MNALDQLKSYIKEWDDLACCESADEDFDYLAGKIIDVLPVIVEVIDAYESLAKTQNTHGDTCEEEYHDAHKRLKQARIDMLEWVQP